MSSVPPHLDETGKPCTRHAAISDDTLLAYAAVGSRVSGFHHDTASKLQSLMMAVEEISEHAGPDLKGAAETASRAINALHQLLAINRALAKPPQPKPTPLRELLARAAERSGAKIAGEISEVDVQVALPSITHALAVLLDVAAGPMKQDRTVGLRCTTGAGIRVQITTRNGVSATPNANELIALAAYLLHREAGSLVCQPDGFVVELPRAD